MGMFFNSSFTNRVDLGNNLDVFQNQSEGTITSWVNITSFNGGGGGQNQVYGFSTGTGAASTRLSLKLEPSNLFVWAGRRLDEHGLTTISGGSVNYGTWQLLALVANWGANTLTGYLDGVQVATGFMTNTGNTPGTNSLNANIGANTDGTAQHINGSIQDCRAYRRALPESEIRAMFQARGRDRSRRDLYHRHILIGPSGVTVPNPVPDSGIANRQGTPINSLQHNSSSLGHHARAKTQ